MEDHKLDETEKSNKKGMAETSTQRQKETKIDIHQEQKSTTLPEETQATTENITSIPNATIKKNDTQTKCDEEGRENNMEITEILTRASIRIMSKIGEKLMESMCYNGWGRKTETGHGDPDGTETFEDTSTTGPIPIYLGGRNRREIPRKTSNEIVEQPTQEIHTNRSSSKPSQDMNPNTTDNNNQAKPKSKIPMKKHRKIQHTKEK